MAISTIPGQALDSQNFDGTGALQLPTGTTAQRPTTPIIGALRFNNTAGINAYEYYNGTAWITGALVGSSGNPATSIQQLATFQSTSGTYYFTINGVTFTAYVEFSGPASKAWMHVGTINDSNEGNQNAAAQIWSASLNPAQSASPWDDNTTFGTQSFVADFKNTGWNTVPFTRWMLRDNGASLRNLFYTNTISASNSSFKAYWAAKTWRASGSDTATAAYSAGRVDSVAVTSYAVSDPTLLGTRSVVLLKFGEYDGTQDTNKDRSMICGYDYTSSSGVDAPMGLGTFTNLGGPQYYRDVTPNVNNADNPPATITGAPLNYTLWITDY